MNLDTPEDDPTILFYDTDYPLPDFDKLDEKHAHLRQYSDVMAYLNAAKGLEGSILDVCCGSGRIGITLAHQGHDVLGVDISKGLLKRYEKRLKTVPKEVRNRVEIFEDDARTFHLDRKADMAMIAFNSLNIIGEFNDQLDTLKAIAQHLDVGGKLVLDLANPYTHNMQGRTSVEPAYRRDIPEDGSHYTRFIAATEVDTDQRQSIYGWYDLVAKDKTLKRYNYNYKWRLIFKAELQMMLAIAGFHIRHIYGGFRQEPYSTKTEKIFVIATKYNDHN